MARARAIPARADGPACCASARRRRNFFGYDSNTTNNRMERMAAIQGLLAFKEPCEIEITTDSEYLLQGATWTFGWNSTS